MTDLLSLGPVLFVVAFIFWAMLYKIIEFMLNKFERTYANYHRR